MTEIADHVPSHVSTAAASCFRGFGHNWNPADRSAEIVWLDGGNG